MRRAKYRCNGCRLRVEVILDRKQVCLTLPENFRCRLDAVWSKRKKRSTCKGYMEMVKEDQ